MLTGTIKSDSYDAVEGVSSYFGTRKLLVWLSAKYTNVSIILRRLTLVTHFLSVAKNVCEVRKCRDMAQRNDLPSISHTQF